MNELLTAAFTLPTTVFSVLLILALVYWALVLLGALDLELFDSLFEIFDGVAEGAAEGAAEGVGEALADGGDHSGCLGLGGVPLTIIGTLLVGFAWIYSLSGMRLLEGATAAAGTTLVVGVGVGAIVLSLGTTAVAARPLRKLFRLPPVTVRDDLVGRICKVTTLKVTERFGQAEVVDGGSAILIQVRSREPTPLTRGSRALIFEYDAAREVFYVTGVHGGELETNLTT